MKGLYDTVQEKFKNVDFLKEDLKQPLPITKVIFRKSQLPKYIPVSGFSYSVFTMPPILF